MVGPAFSLFLLYALPLTTKYQTRSRHQCYMTRAFLSNIPMKKRPLTLPAVYCQDQLKSKLFMLNWSKRKKKIKYFFLKTFFYASKLKGCPLPKFMNIQSLLYTSKVGRQGGRQEVAATSPPSHVSLLCKALCHSAKSCLVGHFSLVQTMLGCLPASN